MKNYTQVLVDENGIEVTVNYDADISESQIEECHGIHEVGYMVETDLKSVEVVIAGDGIDILNILSEKQKTTIISKLTYE